MAARRHTPMPARGESLLQTRAMTASAKGTVDAPGQNVRQKAGLNHVILATGWSGLRAMFAHKAPRLPAPRRPRADLPAGRSRLRSRAALRARPGTHADAHRAERRRHDGRLGHGRADCTPTAARPGRTRNDDACPVTGIRPRQRRRSANPGTLGPRRGRNTAPGGASGSATGRSLSRNRYNARVSKPLCRHDHRRQCTRAVGVLAGGSCKRCKRHYSSPFAPPRNGLTI